MYRSPIKKEIKEEILNKVKEGKDTVPAIAKMYGISSEAIYYWLRQGVGGVTSQVLNNNRLKKEDRLNEKLIREKISPYLK